MATRSNVEADSASTPAVKWRRSNIPDAESNRPNIKQLLKVTKIKDVGITPRWRELGLELVSDNNILNVIETNHRNDVDTCCRKMFEKWLDMRPSASWNQLITALINIGMNTAADVIRKQLQAGVSENIDGEMDHVFSGRSDEHFTVLLKDQSTQQKTQQILQKQQHTDQMMHYREQLIRQKEEILQIKRQLVEKDEVIIQKDQQILQKNQTIYEKDQQLAQKDQQLNQKDQVIYEKDQLLKQKDQKIIEMEAKLNAASKVAGYFTAGEIDVWFPSSWETIPKDSSGKEIGCHLVDLQPSDPEYQKVLTDITSTMPSQETVYDSFGPQLDIVKMQRIQNPTLYAQYVSRKKTMEKENPEIQIESWLYYKCDKNGYSLSENICNQGFNKSIAGPKSTFCGGGVNFLVKSMECDIISTSYMTDEGNRLMFYARVLTGDYTDCKHTGLPYNYGRLLQAPPVKDASKGTRYNSVVDDLYDPRQFAVFHNDQSYPDYLITYTFG